MPAAQPSPAAPPARRRYDDDLRLAHVIADQVDGVTMDRFRALDLAVETKPDLTPVTDADRTAEELVRAQLKRTRPRDAVLGEEFGLVGHGQRQWVVDPIDGTKNFVRGVPVWATLIALLDDGEPVVGLVSAPALQRRWWAATGSGAWTGRSLATATRISVSGVSDLADASFAYSSLGGWEERGALDGFLALTRAVWRTRGYGDFWSYMLLAEGAVDVAAEPELALHDMAALVPVVTEAGGRFTSRAGVDGPHGGDAVATNGHLHAAALAHLGTGATASSPATPVTPVTPSAAGAPAAEQPPAP
ncbi:histidinol-phosphatase [Kineococcus gypseus]|uniref:histidinol-phosphatase n=1 Tax=Kineococcus gypseus TaxID=1637102 RepID=UPI003D7DB33A